MTRKKKGVQPEVASPDQLSAGLDGPQLVRAALELAENMAAQGHLGHGVGVKLLLNHLRAADLQLGQDLPAKASDNAGNLPALSDDIDAPSEED